MSTRKTAINSTDKPYYCACCTDKIFAGSEFVLESFSRPVSGIVFRHLFCRALCIKCSTRVGETP